MSSLWIGLLRVVLKLPNRRPWNADLNERMERSGAPGASFFIADEISSFEKSTFAPPRCCCLFQMNAALYASSLASEPDWPVKTWFRPLGATFSIPVSRISAQSCGGKFPSAGRLIIALAISGEVAVWRRLGLLYPTGMEAI